MSTVEAVWQSHSCVARGKQFSSKTTALNTRPKHTTRWTRRRNSRPYMSTRQVVSSAVDPDNGNDSALSMTSVFGPVQCVYLDFDETITEGLSSYLQVQAVIKGAAKGMSSAEEAAAFVQERKALVARLGAEYEADIKKELMSTLAQFPPGEFNRENIDRAMDMCAEVDRKWSQVGIDHKSFAGVKREDFLKMAPATPVKDHALQSIRAMQKSGMEIVVLSINWSAAWIQRVIGPNSSVISNNGASIPEGHVKIYSNEMLYEDGISTGQLYTLMESGRDKAAVLQKLLQEGQSSSNSQCESKSVFIGDSYNDIQPLLMVDVGIVMGQSKAFLLFAKHFGIQLKPLSEALSDPEAAAMDHKILYTTDSWLEVAEALLGKEQVDQFSSTISTKV